ncbi:hypothetical protein EG68_10171 [Paragonimus skrjabini miyazakii]|uniref:SET domain-containing protein n=1 Tax=Paragonimus skrjabini miyazakii TaxID=59628 RepID=A0A8S9YLK2_9TREM|nr:hypothetical protein EG68_10171 [Paragonimus skrjabini miyazakii]
MDDKKHIVILAQRRIYPGEELTYDYRFPKESDKLLCNCGSHNYLLPTRILLFRTFLPAYRGSDNRPCSSTHKARPMSRYLGVPGPLIGQGNRLRTCADQRRGVSSPSRDVVH